MSRLAPLFAVATLLASPHASAQERVECSGRGVAQFGKCFCDPGFDGESCEKATGCANGCSSRGVCQHGKCFCDPGFDGESCEKATGCGDGCSSRGVCQHGKCFCDPGFDGESCEKATGCGNGCSSRGVCQHGKCFCDPGYEGASCEKPVEAQCPNACSDRGVCVRGKCFCEGYHGGEDCSEAPRSIVLVETPHYSATLLRATGPRRNIVIVKNINVLTREVPIGAVGDVLDDAEVDEALFLPVNQGGTTQTFLRVSFRPRGESSDASLTFVMPVSDEVRRKGRTLVEFARDEYGGDPAILRRMRELQDDLRCAALAEPEFLLQATGWYAEALTGVPGTTEASVMPFTMPKVNLLCGRKVIR